MQIEIKERASLFLKNESINEKNSMITSDFMNLKIN